MWPRSVGASLVLIATLASGCKRGAPTWGCDEAALAEAGAGLSAGRIDEREAIETLDHACPAIPPTLPQRLREDYVIGLPGGPVSSMLGEDVRYTWLRRRTCADPDRWAREGQQLEPARRAAGMFEICELGRYGLLEEGELFLFEDLRAFFLFEYLRGAGVDEAVARGFTRSLMTAAQHGERARRRCGFNPESAACIEQAREQGVELPRSTAADPLREATQLTLAANEVTLDDGSVIRLDATGETITRLLSELKAAVTRGRRAAREADRDWHARMSLRADRKTPQDTLMGVVHAATLAGYRELALLVSDGESVHEIAFWPPPLWYENRGGVAELGIRFATTSDRSQASRSTLSDSWGTDEQPTLELLLEPTRVSVSRGGEPTPLNGDLAHVEAWAAGIRDEHPKQLVVTVAATPTVTLARLVEALDALRGSTCSLGGELAGAPDRCPSFHPILRLDPPFARRPGSWDALRLGEPQVIELDTVHHGPSTPAEHADEVARARPAIRACLLASEQARTWMPERCELEFGIGANGERSVIAYAPPLFGDEQLHDCLRAALGNKGRLIIPRTVHARVMLPIEVPEAAKSVQEHDE